MDILAEGIETYVGLGGFPEPDAATAAMMFVESCESLQKFGF